MLDNIQGLLQHGGLKNRVLAGGYAGFELPLICSLEAITGRTHTGKAFAHLIASGLTAPIALLWPELALIVARQLGVSAKSLQSLPVRVQEVVGDFLKQTAIFFKQRSTIRVIKVSGCLVVGLLGYKAYSLGHSVIKAGQEIINTVFEIKGKGEKTLENVNNAMDIVTMISSNLVHFATLGTVIFAFLTYKFGPRVLGAVRRRLPAYPWAKKPIRAPGSPGVMVEALRNKFELANGKHLYNPQQGFKGLPSVNQAPSQAQERAAQGKPSEKPWNSS